MPLPKLIGVIHLPPLLLAPRAGRAPVSSATRVAIKEARSLEKLGFDSVILENFGDAPFFKDQVPPETIASMSSVVTAVRSECRIPIGVNVLRNDSAAALAIAAACAAQYIRVNVLSGVAATDQGLIEGRAAHLMRRRAQLDPRIRVFADVHVKHARPLSSDSLELAIEETAGRGLADAVVITGSTTGRAAKLEDLKLAHKVCKTLATPLYVGSGATPDHLPELSSHCDGIIVGSCLRKSGRAGAPLDLERAKAMVRAFRASF